MKRKTDRHLPPCVYWKHGQHWLVKRGKWTALGPDLSTALAEYGRILGTPKGGMSDLIDAALARLEPDLAPSTRSQYQTAARRLKSILAEFSPDQVRPKHVAQIKASLSKTPNMANRIISVLRGVFDYALEMQIVEFNPATGVKRHKEAKRERLISPDEYRAIYAHAGERLQIIMDLLVLTGQRVNDVLKLRRDKLLPEGILFKPQKTANSTGKQLIIRWTPELRAVVERASAGKVSALTLLRGRTGKAPDYRSVRDQWEIACAAANVPDAHLHDLRAMSVTAAKRQGIDPKALAGHTTEANTNRYLRSKEIPVVDGPNIRQALEH